MQTYNSDVDYEGKKCAILQKMKKSKVMEIQFLLIFIHICQFPGTRYNCKTLFRGKYCKIQIELG